MSTKVVIAQTSSTPLVDAVLHRGNCIHEAPFHVPGHKRGSRVPPSGSAILEQAMRYDLTELNGLDYLSSPTGAIHEAQTLAAAAWGAHATWFLVNGSTVGIHAAVMATCSGPEDALILPRNCHLSGYNAAVLAGCTTVHALPAMAHGMAHHVTPQEVERAITAAEERGLRPRAVLVVSPTYFGILSDVAALAEVCRRRGVTLIVDEAHGAHLRFLEDGILTNTVESRNIESGYDGQVVSALTAGADIVVQSTHKQLGALTQGAMLHVRHGCEVDTSRISRLLQLLQTSSPSYLVMASLDGARAQAQDQHAIAEAHDAATHINTWFNDRERDASNSSTKKESIRSYNGLTLLRPSTLLSSNTSLLTHGGINRDIAQEPAPGRDPWRFTVVLETSRTNQSSEMHMTGWQAAALLESERDIVAELATHNAIVFAAGIGTTMEHATALTAGLEWLAEQLIHADHTAPNKEGKNNTAKNSAMKNSSTKSDNPSTNDMGDTLDLTSSYYNVPHIPHMALTPREALAAETETVPSALAAGRIAAELLCPYPPGIPALCPGEVIPEGLMEMLLLVMAAGGKVVGAADPSLATVRVVV